MRTTRWWRVLAVTAVVGATGVPAVADPVTDLVAGSVLVQLPEAFASENIEYIGTIPIDASGVSAEVRDVEGRRQLYVSGMKGLSIYDLDDPTAPSLLGHLALPHSQNEDMQVSADGSRAVIAADGGLPAANPVTVGLHIVDTSDPTAPRWQAWLDGDEGDNHTSTCADDACHWIYGNNGSIYHAPADVSSGDDIEIVGRWFDLDERVTDSHALNRTVHPDPKTGEPVTVMVSDSEPRLVIDATNPADPVLLATSNPEDHEGDGFLQHNNTRPNADEWQPRKGGEPGPSDAFGGSLRPGELLIGNSESNVVPQCNEESGGLTTFSMKDFDKGAPIQELHSFRPVNGDWSDGNPAFNGLGCSGHWFDIQDGDNLIAASWYEHGVKVIEVLPDYSMREVGFFQPVYTGAGAAKWVVDDGAEYIVSADYGRGVDILRFHRDAPPPTDDDLRQAWSIGAAAVNPVAEAERLYCRLGAQ